MVRSKWSPVGWRRTEAWVAGGCPQVKMFEQVQLVVTWGPPEQTDRQTRLKNYFPATSLAGVIRPEDLARAIQILLNTCAIVGRSLCQFSFRQISWKPWLDQFPVEMWNMRLVFVHLVCGCSLWRFTSSFRDISEKEQNKSTFRLLLFHPFFHRQVSILSVVGTIFSFIHHGINLQIERVGIAPRLGVTFLQQSSNQKPSTSHRDPETDRLNFQFLRTFHL